MGGKQQPLGMAIPDPFQTLTRFCRGSPGLQFISALQRILLSCEQLSSREQIWPTSRVKNENTPTPCTFEITYMLC
jgi:hypothetical protein